MAEVSVRAPNSLLLIGDPLGKPPAGLGGQLVATTSSCLAVGVLSDVDGETRVRLIGRDDTDEELPASKAFEGDLELKNHRLIVGSVLGDRYLEWPTSTTATRVGIQLWVNDQGEPNDICIVVLD